MFVAYRTVVGSIEFVVNLRDHEHHIDIDIGPVNVIPNPGTVGTRVSKSDTLEQFLDHYTKFILKSVSDITNCVNELEWEILPPEKILPEACEKCAYWGNPTDTADKRVCRYWDIPERECFTGPYEHCSQGYVNKTDALDVTDVEPPTLKKIWTTTAPDFRHSYLNRYLTELHDTSIPKEGFNAYGTLRNVLKELLSESLDKSEEK